MADPTPRPMLYRLELTADEMNSLRWLEARGYTADLIQHATEETEGEDGSVVLAYTEPDAWQVRDKAHKRECTCGAFLDFSETWNGGNQDPEDHTHAIDEDAAGELDDDFGTCAGGALLRKMHAFLGGII